MEPDSLKTEFSVGSNASGEVQINVQPFSKYPANSFRDVEKRQNLAWILLDDDVRRSYESIGLHQLKYGEDKTKYRKFDFSFKPPLLSGAHITVRGRYLKDLDCMFAFEIPSIQDLLYKTPAKVEFFHPRVKEYVRGSGTRGIYPNYSGQNEQSITTDEANADMTRQLMSVQTASIGFLNNVETNIVYKNRQVGSAGRQDENISERPLRAGSVEDSTLNGNVAPLDWNDLVDDVVGDNKYRNRFDSFFQMIKILQSDYGCKILSEETQKLPSIKRCKKHLMANGEAPRCYAVVEVEAKGRRFHVIEVDTSDGLHSLSTLLLAINSHDEWLQNVTSFERKLLRRSINWPNKFLKTLCGENGYKRIRHPRSNGQSSGGLQTGSNRRWAERFYGRIGDYRPFQDL